MSRPLRHQWVRSIGQLRRQSAKRPIAGSFPLHRRLRFEPLEDRWLLANVTVGNTNDVVNGNVTSIAALIGTPGADGISLREAIQAANADAAADTIDFAPSVTGTIQLTNVGHAGEIAITNNLTISGPGANVLTIRAFAGTAAVRDGTRIFNVDDGVFGTFKDVSISGLTLSGGDVNGAGGAIRNSTENLTLSACTISGNHAVSGGGLHNNAGHLSVSGSTISGNTVLGSGAGIETTGGSLNVLQSTISGNSATSGGSGGGILSSSSTATIDSSTISGNSANSGGGIAHTGSGSGVLMTITSSTISGNSARSGGGGVSVVFSDLIVRHSTITLNKADSDGPGTAPGGGLFVNSVLTNVTIDHTIVAGNLENLSSTRDDIFGPVTARYSLIGDNTGATITNNGGNQIGTGGAPIFPLLLGPLADNGGPTKTHALLASSPALDRGDPAAVAGGGGVPLHDQRDVPFVRVFDGDGAGGAQIDIGAYERHPLAGSFFVVDMLADEYDSNYSAGDLSLREAIDLANGSSNADTINFDASLTSGGPATILLTLGELAIRDSMTIQGPGANLLTIDATGNDPTPVFNNGDGSRVFNIDDRSATRMLEVEIADLKFTGGDLNGYGGAIFNREMLTVTRSTITGNHAGNGGGIHNRDRGDLTIRDSTISDNRAGRGGGIFNFDGDLMISRSTISGNVATPRFGGGIYNRLGTVTVLNSTISTNTEEGIHNDTFGSLIVRNSTVTGNFGGIFNSDSSGLTLDHTIVAGNDDFELSGSATISFSLIGVGAEFLGPLADNGGSTKTHALLAGSPAIDAGDPTASAGVGTVPQFDQRGFPFTRAIDGDGAGGPRIDIGAFELHPLPPTDPALLGDYNLNGVVDAPDYVVWRKTLGTGGLPAFSGADGSGNGVIDQPDHGVWRAHFGETLPPPGGGGDGGNLTIESSASIAAVVPVSETLAHVAASLRDADGVEAGGHSSNTAAAARAASFAVLETRSVWHDSRSRSRGTIDRYQVAESGDDELSLLLAIDRLARSPRQDLFVSDDSENVEHRTDDDSSESESDEPLTVALVVW